MKLFEKVTKDIKQAKSKGYSVAKSWGSYKSFCKLSGLNPDDISSNLVEFNKYLNKHNIQAVLTSKGILYGFIKDIKPNNKKREPELTL